MKTLADILEILDLKTDIDLYNALDTDLPIDEVNEDADLQEPLYQHVSERKIVYYSKAMEYLSNNDNSLRESVEFAVNMGYELGDIDSELLATLLYQDELKEKANEIIGQIMDEINEQLKKE